MKRRAWLAGTGATALLPRVLHAQPAPLRRIGFLCGAAQAQWQPFVAAFHEGLSRAGFVDGRQVHTEYRWADGEYGRLPALAQELVQTDVAVLVATGGAAAVNAAKRHAARVPVVFTLGNDPVALGLMDNLARPSGNMTGALLFALSLMGKRLELLRELLPKGRSFGLLVNADSPAERIYVGETESAARALGVKLDVLRVRSRAEIEAAMSAASQRQLAGIVISPEPLFDTHREAAVELASRLSMPAIYGFREYVALGGLMSYGPSLTAAYRQAGDYVGRILRGATPAELPVVQPASFELALNNASARALGIEWPRTLLLRADEVIA